MGVQIQCPHCGQAYALSDEQAPQYAGQSITCTQCARAFTVPDIAAPAPPSAPAPAPAPTRASAAPSPAADLLPRVAPELEVVGTPPTYPNTPPFGPSVTRIDVP